MVSIPSLSVCASLVTSRPLSTGFSPVTDNVGVISLIHSISQSNITNTKKTKVAAIRYEARSRGRSSPDSLAF